ncbi:MAG: glycosyltransferase family 4 protein [Hyphomicrobiales bacterium]
MSATKAQTRIAVVASYAPSLLQFRGPLIEELVRRGHKVLGVAPGMDERTRKGLADIGADSVDFALNRTGLNPIADLRSIRELTGLFQEWEPDVVMGYTPKGAIYASLAAARAKVPRIVPMVTGLGYSFLPGGGLKGQLVRRITERLYRRAFAVSHGIIFHNDDDARVLMAAGVVPRNISVNVVRGSGVDLERFKEQPLPGIAEGLTFLMIARLVRYKGVEEYCEAAQRLFGQGVKARCLLVGPPENGPAAFPAEELLKFKPAIRYLGPAEDVRPHLARCHVYVLPSYGEGMPRTVLEALATGRPVITTETRGCRETVRPRENGFLVPVGDPAGLASAMMEFFKRPDLLAPMAKKSRELAEAEFDVGKVNEAMIEALGLDEAQ